MITPRSRGTMRCSADSVPCTTPRYVTSATRRNSSAFIWRTGENTLAMALLIQMSIGPKASSTRDAASSTACAFATSTLQMRARPPAVSTSSPAPFQARSTARQKPNPSAQACERKCRRPADAGREHDNLCHTSSIQRLKARAANAFHARSRRRRAAASGLAAGTSATRPSARARELAVWRIPFVNVAARTVP
jgi:hypothetical protein